MFEAIAHFLKIVLMIAGLILCVGLSIVIWFVAHEMKRYE